MERNPLISEVVAEINAQVEEVYQGYVESGFRLDYDYECKMILAKVTALNPHIPPKTIHTHWYNSILSLQVRSQQQQKQSLRSPTHSSSLLTQLKHGQQDPDFLPMHQIVEPARLPPP
jgi:hypothetical protein